MIIAILESAVKVVAVTDVVVTQITVARIKRGFLLKDIISTNLTLALNAERGYDIHYCVA